MDVGTPHTAFFKSLSGQVEIVRGGGPFVYFDLGGGSSATCNPISEADLAMAIVDRAADPAAVRRGRTHLERRRARCRCLHEKAGRVDCRRDRAVDGGERKEPWLLPVPIGVFDGIVGAIKWVYDLTGADSVRCGELGKLGGTTPPRTCSRRPMRALRRDVAAGALRERREERPGVRPLHDRIRQEPADQVTSLFSHIPSTTFASY